MITFDYDKKNRVRYNSISDPIFNEGMIVEPVTIDEVMSYAKIDTGSIDNTIIQYLITTARQQCEDFTGISIIPKTVTVIVNNLNGGIFLPYCPMIAFTSITDKYGNLLTIDQYKLLGTIFPQLLWPKWDRMTLIYTTGYTTLPQEIKTAVLQQVFYLYENRGESAIVSRSGIVVDLTLSPQAKSTLQRIRRVG